MKDHVFALDKFATYFSGQKEEGTAYGNDLARKSEL